ncbi:hypothetical protein Agub_g6656 [Astrephomene gubernaculifera]|uniref:RING-type domain-containing protein n=1 Tax=Astrephomene gubernaculifera TaxID=47775 RepID=A0AAD3DP86_9CHLO|nr:hypothetical protein Agub_g6656 [Astrephomene gubernaculifera]
MEDEAAINCLVGLPTADQRRAATAILRTDVLAAVRALAGCQRCGFVEQVLSAFDPSTLVTNSSLTYNHNSAATSWDNASHPTAPSVMPPAQLLALLSASGNPSELVGLLQFAWRDPAHGGSGSPEAPPSGGSGSSSSGGLLALSDSLLGNTRLLRRFLTQSLGVMQALSEELGDCRRHAGCPGPSELAASLARLHTQRRHTRERLAAWGVLMLGDSGGGQQQEGEEEGQQEGEPHGGRQQRGGQELTRQQEEERPVEGSGAKGAVKEAGGGGGAEEEGGGDDPQVALAIRLSLQEAAAAAAEEGEEERTGSATTSSSTPPAPPGSHASHSACMVDAAAVAALPAGLRERVEHLVSQLRAVEQRLGRLQHACQHGVQAGGRKLLLLLLQLMWSNLRRHYRAAAAEAADVGRGQAAGRRAVAAAGVGAAGAAEQLGGHECPMGHLARLRRRQRRYEGVLAELAAGLSDEEEGGDVEEAGLGEGFDASLLSLQGRRATGAESASRQGGVPHEEAAGQRQRRRQGRESGGQQEVLGQSSGMEARRSLTASAAAAATGKVAAAHATPARMASQVAAAGSATATGARATTEERLEGDRDAAAAPRVAGSSNSSGSRPQVARLPAPVPACPVSTFAAVEHTSTPAPPHARASPHHTTPARPTPIPAATQQPHEPMTVVLDYAAAAGGGGGGAAPAAAAGCGGVGSHAHGGGVAGTDSGSGLESGCSSGCSSSNSSCCCSCGAADCRAVREEQAEQLQALQCQLSACRASQSELQGEVGRLLDMLAHSRRAGEQAVSSLQSQLSRMRGEAGALAGLGPEELGRLAGEMEAALGRVRAAQLQAAAAREQQCPVCWERRKELVFGCGHQTCGECGERLSACPICRTTISIRIRVYG